MRKNEPRVQQGNGSVTEVDNGQSPDSVWRRTAVAIYQTTKDFFTDSGPLWAAAIAFYSLLSAFPLMLGAIVIGSYFVDTAEAVGWATRLLSTFLPLGEAEMI
jgi:uncharacterized BrkB/YihY/UPF0761 family membrane protein